MKGKSQMGEDICNIYIKKRGKKLDRHYTKQSIQMANII